VLLQVILKTGNMVTLLHFLLLLLAPWQLLLGVILHAVACELQPLLSQRRDLVSS
jgi:hypothetical protein